MSRRTPYLEESDNILLIEPRDSRGLNHRVFLSTAIYLALRSVLSMLVPNKH